MSEQHADTAYFRERAEREIALAKATGAKAHASPDFKTVFIERPDGTKDTLRVPPPSEKPKNPPLAAPVFVFAVTAPCGSGAFAREVGGLLDPFFVVDAPAQTQVSIDPGDVLRRPRRDLVEMKDAQRVKRRLL